MGLWRDRFRELHPKRFFLETWAEMDARADEARAKRREEGLGPDWTPFIVLGVGSIILALLEYFGDTNYFLSTVRDSGGFETNQEWREYFDSHHHDLSWQGKAWWAGWRITGYIIIPALMIRFWLKERIRDHGFGFDGVRDHLWIYGLAAIAVSIMAYGASFSESFVNKYPMYKYAGASSFDFWSWELMYAAQFLGLEFFFRGTWIKSLERTMGSAAIAAMVVPYCMIHFGKPFPETIGAILAGTALGTLAVKSRSIWPGFLVHVTVAISMDLAALARKGELFGG